MKMGSKFIQIFLSVVFALTVGAGVSLLAYENGAFTETGGGIENEEEDVASDATYTIGLSAIYIYMLSSSSSTISSGSSFESSASNDFWYSDESKIQITYTNTSGSSATTTKADAGNSISTSSLTYTVTGLSISGYECIGIWSYYTDGDDTLDYFANSCYSTSSSASITNSYDKATMSIVLFYRPESNYTITYNANSGTASTTTATVSPGDSITLQGTCYRSGYSLLGWSTSSSATTATYKAGAAYTPSASVTLYAVWSKNTYLTTGTGSSSSKFQISTVNQLTELATKVNAGCTFHDTYFKLTTNIEIEDSWTSIGSSSSYWFSGYFDGDGYTVTFTDLETSTSSYRGLFGRTYGAYIENVSVAGEISGGSYTGGIVGYARNTSLSYCANFATISGSYTNHGGLVGYMLADYESEYTGRSLSIFCCANFGSVSGSAYVGGIVGYCYFHSSYGMQGNIYYSYNTGSVTGSSYYVGGLVGASYNYSSWVFTVNDCYNSGDVQGTYYVGGIFGRNSYGLTMYTVYNRGSVTGTSTSYGYVGGIVGYLYGTSSYIYNYIYNCFNIGEVTSAYSTYGGIAGYSSGSTYCFYYKCYYGGSCSGTIGAIAGADYTSSTSYYATCTSLADSFSEVSSFISDTSYWNSSHSWSSSTSASSTSYIWVRGDNTDANESNDYYPILRWSYSIVYGISYYTNNFTSFSGANSTGGTLTITYTMVDGTFTSESSIYSSNTPVYVSIYQPMAITADPKTNYATYGYYSSKPTTSNYSSFTKGSTYLLYAPTYSTTYSGYFLFVRYVTLKVDSYYTSNWSSVTNGTTGGNTTLTYTTIYNESATATSGSVQCLYSPSTAPTVTFAPASGYAMRGYTSSSSPSASSSYTTISTPYASSTAVTLSTSTAYTIYAVYVQYTMIWATPYYTSDWSTMTIGTTGGTITISYTDITNTSTTTTDGYAYVLYSTAPTLSYSANTGYTFRGYTTSVSPTSSSTYTTSVTLSSGTSYIYTGVFVRYVTLTIGLRYTSDWETISNGSTGGTVTLSYTNTSNTTTTRTFSGSGSATTVNCLYSAARTLSYTAADGYVFRGYTTSSSPTSSSTYSTSVTLSAGTTYSYYAVFVQYVTSTIYVNNLYTSDWDTISGGSTGGTVTLTYKHYTNNEYSLTASLSISSSSKVLYGSDSAGSCTVTAEANDGYVFVGWYSDDPASGDTPISTEDDFTYAAGLYPTIYACFVQYVTSSIYMYSYYTSNWSTVSNGNTGGTLAFKCKNYANAEVSGDSMYSVAISTSVMVLYGSDSVGSCTVTATANDGYVFVGWYSSKPSSSGVPLSTDEEFSYAAGVYPTICACFVQYVELTVGSFYTSNWTTVTSGTTGGTVTLSYTDVYNESATATSGTVKCLYSATPSYSYSAKTGYIFRGYTTSSSPASSSSYTTSPTFTSGTSYTYYGVFVRYVTLKVGTRYTSDWETVSTGSTGGKISYSYTSISNSTGNGTSPNSSSAVSMSCLYSSTPTISYTVVDGYAFRGYTTDSSPTSSSTYVTSLSLTSGTSYEYYAVFVKVSTVYVYNYYTSDWSTLQRSDDIGGVVTVGWIDYAYAVDETIASVSISKVLYGSDAVETVYVDAEASEDYTFVGWYDTTSPTSSTTPVSTSSTFSYAAYLYPTIVAVFMKTLSVSSSAYYAINYDSDATLGTLGGTVSATYDTDSTYGDVVTFYASASTGYVFAGWYSDAPTTSNYSSPLSTDTTYTTTASGSEVNCYGLFVKYATVSLVAYYTSDYLTFSGGGGTVQVTSYTSTDGTSGQSSTATARSSATILYGESATIYAVTASSDEYQFVGWMTEKPTSTNCTSSDSTTSSSTLTFSAGTSTAATTTTYTRYAVFAKITSVTITNYLTNTYTSVSQSNAGGTVAFTYTLATNKTNSASLSSTTTRTTVTVLYGGEISLTATDGSGYQIYGWFASDIEFSDYEVSTSPLGTDAMLSLTPSTDFSEYSTSYSVNALFVPTLSFDASGGYWYYEDGEYPQSFHSRTAPSGLSDTASYTLTINGEAVPVYTASDGNKYALVTSGSVSAYFLVEPIKWIVFFGSTYSTDWLTSSTTAVSAYVITYGTASASSVSAGWSWADSDLLGEVLDSTSNFDFDSDYSSWTYDSFSGTVGQKVVSDDAVTLSSIVTIASIDEIDALGGTYRARCTDLVAFLSSGGSDVSGGTYSDYWVRDLAYGSFMGTEGNSMYITYFGTTSTAWLDNSLGARLSITI